MIPSRWASVPDWQQIVAREVNPAISPTTYALATLNLAGNAGKVPTVNATGDGFIWASGGGVTDADYGDITVLAGVWTIDAGAVTLSKIATAALNTLSTPYRTLLDSSGSHTAARVAGTYFLPQGQAAGITGTGTLYSPNIIYLDPADYPAIGSLVAKLRLRCSLATNDVAPTGNYTIGLYPLTRPATSGGAGLAIYTMGTVVSGSTATATAPAADALVNLVSGDFSVPAAGHYAIGFVTTSTVAASAHVHLSAALQLHYA